MAIEIWRRLLVDRIGITVNIVSTDLYQHVFSQFYSMQEEQAHFVPNGKIIVRCNQYTTRLDYYAEHAWKKTGRRNLADITIGAHKHLGQDESQRYLTLTLYPSQFRDVEFINLKLMLEIMLPDFNYPKLFATGRVNYLELAIDTLSHQHRSFLPYRKYCSSSCIYKKGQYRGTLYIGSRLSDQRFRLYDKRRQLIEKGKATFTKELPHTRIEAVLRRLKIPPANLHELCNPFEKLLIADLGKAQAALNHSDWFKFLDESINDDGVPTALAKRPYSRRKQYRKMLDAHSVPFWKPQDIWADLPQALAAIAP